MMGLYLETHRTYAHNIIAAHVKLPTPITQSPQDDSHHHHLFFDLVLLLLGNIIVEIIGLL